MTNQKLTPVYSIESATISGNIVKVDYLLNNDWKETEVNYNLLEEFAINMGMNDYCFDKMEDEHVQDSGTSDIDNYMAENLDEVVKYFLESIHNPFEAIIQSINVLTGEFNGRRAVA